MTKLMEFFEKIAPYLLRFANVKFIKIMQSAFVTTMPVLLIGSTFLLFAAFPVPAIKELLKPLNLGAVSNVTMELYSLFLVMTIAYHTAEENQMKFKTSYNKMIPIILAVSSYVLLCMPLWGDMLIGEEALNQPGLYIPMAYLGTKGILAAIMTGYVSTEIFEYFIKNKIIIKMPEQVPPMVAQSFASIIPFFAVITFWWVVSVVMGINVPQFFLDIFRPFVAMGDTLPAVLSITFLNRALWMVGIHGSNVVGAVAGPLMTSMGAENLAVGSAQVADMVAIDLPYIASTYFYDVYVWVGFVPLALVLMRSKNDMMRKLGYLSIVPAIFNIGEPLIFGIPIVLNPLMFIPFVLGYLVLAGVSFVLVKLGILAAPFMAVMWTMPAPIKAYLSTNYDVFAVVYVIVAWVFLYFLFLPFVRMYEKQEEKKLQAEE